MKYEVFNEEGAPWGRGSFINSLLGTENLITVAVDEDGPGQPNTIPRRVNIEMVYYQRDQFRKSLVSARIWYDDLCTFSKTRNYSKILNLHLIRPFIPARRVFMTIPVDSLEAADWLDLMNFFEFGYDLYTAFFIGIGFITVFIGMVWWAAALATRLKHPPSFKFLSFLRIIAPPPFYGTFLSLCPVFFGIILIYVWFITLTSDDPRILI